MQSARTGKKQFGIGTALVAVLICALLLGWWRTSVQLEQAEAQLDEILRSQAALAHNGKTHVEQTSRQPLDNRFETPESFVSALRRAKDWQTFQHEDVRPFVGTAVADDAVLSLLILLQDPDPDVRKKVVHTLGQMKRHADRIVPKVIALLKDDDLSVGMHAAIALQQLNTDDPAAIAALKAQMNNDDSPIAGFCAVQLERLDESIDTESRAVELLFSSIPENRYRATEWVLVHKRPGALDALVRAHRIETDPEIREQMARVIGMMTD